GRELLPRLHAITDERIARRADLDEVARALAAGGGDRLAFHARGRTLSGLEHYELATRLAVYPSARLFVNDRLDVALAVAAAGVQLGAGSLDPQDARRLEPRWWIGKSVHGLEEAVAARAAGADYLLVGPLYRTATHPEREPPRCSGCSARSSSTPAPWWSSTTARSCGAPGWATSRWPRATRSSWCISSEGVDAHDRSRRHGPGHAVRGGRPHVPLAPHGGHGQVSRQRDDGS